MITKDNQELDLDEIDPIFSPSDEEIEEELAYLKARK
jgi:hypothetical protein